MARASHWARLRRARDGIPYPMPQVAGALYRLVAPGEPDKIGGLHFRAMAGRPHQLDRQTITFTPPIWPHEVPSPWDKLLNPNIEP